jgi:integrase/recombinase XerD
VHVQRVAVPGSRVVSWTVLGDDDIPVGPIERYLAYLSDIERSPNTAEAYAYDLKDYWIFLRYRGLDWREVRLEDIGEYVAWLRLPPGSSSKSCCGVVNMNVEVKRFRLGDHGAVRVDGG